MIRFTIVNVLFITLFLKGCQSQNEDTVKQEKAPQPQEIKLEPNIFFISSTPPYDENTQQTLLKTLNTGMAEAARQAGQDSATQFIGRDSPQAGKQPPTYKDIKFFPVLTKKDLKETVELKYAGRDERDSLRTFNLDQNFALIVTHPPSFRNITYSDYVAMKPSSGDTLYLVLESTKIANSSSSVSTGQFWKTSVYKMPRKKHALLGVIFKGDTTYYNLGDF